METVLFLMRYPLDEKHHLQNKFNGEMQAFINLGFDVYHLGYNAEGMYIVNFKTQEKQRLSFTLFRKYKKYRNTLCFLDLFRSLNKLAKYRQFTYIYMRNKPIDIVGLHALKKLKAKGAKLIVEKPSYHSYEKELSLGRSIIRKVLSRWTEQFSNLVDLYTIIGPDCGGTYKQRPAINIMNGVCVDQMPLRNYQPTNNIHLLALASMRIWHAYDRLINGLAEYKGDLPIIIDMVGGDNDGSLTAWKRLAYEKKVDDKIVFHGPMYGEELNKMFDIADIGIATLGLHRNKMPTGSVLKLGEYCARGLPFVYGYNDKTFTGNEKFAIKVPEDETPVDFKKIIELVLYTRQNPDVCMQMRQYAQENMSWEKQMNKVIDYFRKNGK